MQYIIEYMPMISPDNVNTAINPREIPHALHKNRPPNAKSSGGHNAQNTAFIKILIAMNAR